MKLIEQFETRTLFANYAAADVPELIAAMNAANASGEADTITLAAGATFSLTEVDNNTHGATGLPVIVPGGGALTVAGNGATIERAHEGGIFFGLPLRLFDVAAGASLTLNDLTLQGGLAGGSVPGVSEARGGAIHNLGTVTLAAVTLQNNAARGNDGSNNAGVATSARAASGGGIYSAGALNMTSCILQNNQSRGGWGGDAYAWIGVSLPATPGADGAGGGIYIAGGSATITGSTFSSNGARGGPGGRAINSGLPKGAPGGNGFGGGLFTGAGAVTVRGSTFTLNHASGGSGGLNYSGPGKPSGKPYAVAGRGIGGGIYTATRSLGLDASTLLTTTGNTSTTSDPDIYGRYSTI